MPYGFFTIEQWKPRKRRGMSEWITVAHIDACQSLSDAIRRIEERGRPGFFRVIQTQRQIWAEKVNGRLRLRKWHAGSHASLALGAAAFVRDKGRWPTKAK
ncbi:MAG TPA: hypothetical protein VMG59_07325 [Phycisphaerae bacterium]|nr:hypothetical protein [Phycisphaerae bacterium]